MMFSVYILPFHVFVTSQKGIIPIFFNISPPTKKAQSEDCAFEIKTKFHSPLPFTNNLPNHQQSS